MHLVHVKVVTHNAGGVARMVVDPTLRVRSKLRVRLEFVR